MPLCLSSEWNIWHSKWILKSRKFMRRCRDAFNLSRRQARRARCPFHSVYLYIFGLELHRGKANNALLVEMLTGEDIHINHLVRWPHVQADMTGGNDDKARIPGIERVTCRDVAQHNRTDLLHPNQVGILIQHLP